MIVHPLLVHFPIALLLVGTLGLLASLLWPTRLPGQPLGRAAFEGFLNGALGLGYAGLVLSVVSGLFDMQAGPKAQAREGWIVLAVLHIISGVSLLVIYGSLLYRRFVLLPPSIPTEPDAPELPINVETEEISGSGSSGPIGLQTHRHTRPALAKVAPVRAEQDWLSLALAVLALVVLIAAGFLGGSLVYDYRVGIS